MRRKKKLLVFVFVAVVCATCYGDILVYKTTTNNTVFTESTTQKKLERGYLVLDVNLVIQTVISAQQIVYSSSTGQEVKIADVEFSKTSIAIPPANYIVAEYLCGGKDVIMSGRAKLTNIGFGSANKKLVATNLSGFTLVRNDVSGSGTMIATLNTKLTKTANMQGDSITVVVDDITDSLAAKYGELRIDTTSPEPNTMTFAVAPDATSESSITMTATIAIDTDSPPVQYLFTNVTDPNKSSQWQTSETFTNTGLTEDTTYTYNVKARDNATPTRNQTAASANTSATTDQTADSTAPTPNPMTFAVEPNATSDSQITMTATTATDAHGVEYFFTNVTFDDANDANHNSEWQDSATYTDTGLASETTYAYNVKARDKSTLQNSTAASSDANATTAEAPDPYVSQLNVQGCNSSSGQYKSDSNDIRFSITVQGNNLYFEDLIEANCCKDRLELNVEVEDNKITIREIEISSFFCLCLCDYPTTAILGPFNDGNYTVSVIDVAGNPLGTVSRTIPSQ